MNFNHKPEQTDFELVPAGDYEVFVVKAEERPTSKGRLQLSVMLKIRDDVEQACKNRTLFLNIYQKTPEKLTDADREVCNYNYTHLYHLLDVTGVLNSGKDFESISDICRMLAGCELRVTVYHNTYNGKTSEKIDQLKGVHESEAYPEDCIPAQNNLTPAYGAPAKTPAYSALPAPAVPPAPAAPASGGIDDFGEIISGGDDLPF